MAGGPGLDSRICLFRYEARAAQAVQRLKYERATCLASELSRLLFEFVDAQGLLVCDLIVPVPIHWSRLAHRGFNQSELLCESMPKDKTRTDALKRIRATPPQARLSHDERFKNLKDAFRASKFVEGKSVLLVDDVLTSGQTFAECANALKQAGATKVDAVALCGSDKSM